MSFFQSSSLSLSSLPLFLIDTLTVSLYLLITQSFCGAWALTFISASLQLLESKLHHLLLIHLLSLSFRTFNYSTYNSTGAGSFIHLHANLQKVINLHRRPLMFTFTTGMLTRPVDHPSHYRAANEFRSPSPDLLDHSVPPSSHTSAHHHHHTLSTPERETPTAAGQTTRGADAVVPLRQREVVLPARRAPQTTPGAHRTNVPPTQMTATASSSAATPTATVERQGEGHRGHQHHHHPRRARSSEIRRAASTTEARNSSGIDSDGARRVPAATSGSSARRGHGDHGSSQGSASFGRVLAAGLRGFQTYMGMMFQSGNHGGMNPHPTPYDTDSSNSIYRVPESPPSPVMQRTTSEIVAGREHRRRVRAQLTGITVDAQHELLRRLRFSQAAVGAHETESAVSGPASACEPSSPLSTRTPLSSLLPPDYGDDGDAALASWVVSLDLADTLAVPFPATSQSCSVCLRRFRDAEDVAELPCGHLYHFSCIIRWLKRQGSCPCCRADVRLLRWREPPADNAGEAPVER